MINIYVNALAVDDTQTGGIQYILVYVTQDGKIHHSIGNDLNILIDKYDVGNLIPDQTLIKVGF